MFPFQNGVILSNNRKLIFERIDENHPQYEEAKRQKRDVNDDDMIVIYETEQTGGECGIKPKNLKRMKAPKREAVLLKNNEEGNESKAFIRKRKKRSASSDKAIELAVFVDDELYYNEKEASNSEDVILRIQNIVFTFLNAVQISIIVPNVRL